MGHTETRPSVQPSSVSTGPSGVAADNVVVDRRKPARTLGRRPRSAWSSRNAPNESVRRSRTALHVPSDAPTPMLTPARCAGVGDSGCGDAGAGAGAAGSRRAAGSNASAATTLIAWASSSHDFAVRFRFSDAAPARTMRSSPLTSKAPSRRISISIDAAASPVRAGRRRDVRVASAAQTVSDVAHEDEAVTLTVTGTASAARVVPTRRATATAAPPETALAACLTTESLARRRPPVERSNGGPPECSRDSVGIPAPRSLDHENVRQRREDDWVIRVSPSGNQ